MVFMLYDIAYIYMTISDEEYRNALYIDVAVVYDVYLSSLINEPWKYKAQV